MYRLSQLFVTLFAVALSTGLQGQQVTARVAGLESNAKYMSLLEQEQRLHRTEDSVVQVINDTRKLLPPKPPIRKKNSSEPKSCNSKKNSSKSGISRESRPMKSERSSRTSS